MSYATITLKLFKGGILFDCEEADISDVIPYGNGNRLMELLNEVEEICDPDATFEITEEGRQYLQKLKDENNE